MVKLTLIMIVQDAQDTLTNLLESIINQSYPHLELICITSDDNSILRDYSRKDNRIRINNTENIIKSCNEILVNADGDYILFVDEYNILEDSILEKLVNQVEDSPDIILFKTNSIENEHTYNILAFNQNKTFNHKQISDILFDIEPAPFNKLYRKQFLDKMGIQLNTESSCFFETFNYKTILKADKISYKDIPAYKTNHQKIQKHTTETFKKYVNTQNNNLNLFENEEYYKYASNNKIENTINYYDKLSIKYKKEAYKILREDYLSILWDDKITHFINSLTDENHKKLEQVIISESAEEYELLKEVYDDKKIVNFNKCYEKILEAEHGKVKRFNDSLKSSNSWRITKIFRI